GSGYGHQVHRLLRTYVLAECVLTIRSNGKSQLRLVHGVIAAKKAAADDKTWRQPRYGPRIKAVNSQVVNDPSIMEISRPFHLVGPDMALVLKAQPIGKRASMLSRKGVNLFPAHGRTGLNSVMAHIGKL